MKTISVVLTSYNYAHYLPTALSAILKQTLSPLEIIVIDDASTDHSVEIIQQFQKNSPLIQLYQNKKNLGLFPNVNRGIDLARGDYIALCAADDEMLPNFFEESMALLNQYPQAGICSSIFTIFFDREPHKLHSFSSLLSKERAFFTPSQFLRKIKRSDARLGGQNTIYKTSALREAGNLLPELGHMCDWFVISVLALRYGVCFVPETLTKMRIHQKAFSQEKSRDKIYCQNLFKNVLAVLNKKEFSDVKEPFINSGILYHLGLPIVRELFRKENRKYIRIPLIYHLLNLACKTLKGKIQGMISRIKINNSAA